MLRTILSALIISGLAAFVAASMTSPASAGHRHAGYHNGTRVKGFVQRRGGYSYSYPDSINTYGDSRSNYGGASVYRDPNLDKQTVAGPFDHGFFFDSGMGGHGGDSPYMN